jgi:hypothetical protein
MFKFDIGEWVIQECPKDSTHALKGSFADPESGVKAAANLFCYNQNTGTGAFFAIGKKHPGEDGPYKVGVNHTFIRRWTHIAYIPIFSFISVVPQRYKLLLFYEATSGMAEVYETDGTGNLSLRKHHSGWRTYWTQIIGGEFGTANLLFYDAAHGVGAFYALSKLGDIQLIESWV